MSARVGAAVGVTFVLTSCGSSSTTIATSSTQVTKFASETPAQILAASARATDSAKSVRISGTLQASNFKQGNITLAVVYPSRLSITIVRGQTEEQVVSVPAGTDLRANLAYWDSKGPKAIAQRYANRWLTLDGSAGETLAKKFQTLLTVYMARNVACTLARFPRPTLVETTTVAGQVSLELHSNGPSGHDSKNLYIAAAAPHFPLRQDVTVHAAEPAVSSCPRIPGAKPASGSVSYSDWNVVTITTPAHTTTLPSLAGA
jgi:hypothetical protein